MRRATQNILLLLLGGALLQLALTGAYLRYVKPAHHWLLILAGATTLTLAAVSIIRDLRGARPDGTDGHAHDHRTGSAWLLILPILAVFLVAPPALGADSVERAAGSPTRITPTAADGSTLYPKLPPRGVVALQVSEFAERSAWDSAHSLDGRSIKLTGFVVHEGRATYLARVAISCCAADAYPAKVELLDHDLSTVHNDQWIEAVVVLEPDSATRADAYVPAAHVHTVTRVAQPDDPYEH